MNRSFKKVAFFFFLGFGIFYLGSDFLLHQVGGALSSGLERESETLLRIYKTFDMPFFFSAGMYFLASFHEMLERRFEIPGLYPLFFLLGVLWTIFLMFLNGGYDTFL